MSMKSNFANAVAAVPMAVKPPSNVPQHTMKPAAKGTRAAKGGASKPKRLPLGGTAALVTPPMGANMGDTNEVG